MSEHHSSSRLYHMAGLIAVSVSAVVSMRTDMHYQISNLLARSTPYDVMWDYLKMAELKDWRTPKVQMRRKHLAKQHAKPVLRRSKGGRPYLKKKTK